MSRIKGITVWEQYAEFFVLGLAALALIVFAAMQFIGSPNAADVPGRGKIHPHQVDSMLVEEAQRLQARLSPDAPADDTFGTPQSILPDFEGQLSASISPRPSLQQSYVFVHLDPGEVVRGDAIFVEPEVPAPTATVVRQYFDTLLDDVVDEYDGLREFVPTQPYDVTWATVAAAIEVEHVLDEFRRGGPDGDPAPIPASWYGEQVTIIDVRLEREEYVDGQWTNRAEVALLPGQFSFRDQIRRGVDATRRDSILRNARDSESQRMIARPDFFATRNGSFVPPDPFEPELDADAPEEMRELRRLRELERRLAQLRQDLDDLGGPLTGDPGRPGRPSPGDGGGPLGGGSGGGVGGGPLQPGDGAPDTSRNEQQRRNLMQRIERTERQIEGLRARLPEVDDDPVDDDRNGVKVVWAHDLGIRPGGTYRYRAVVDIYNPFFARRLHLMEQQQGLADSFVLSSEPGEWSEAFEARSPLHHFITRAYAPGQERGSIGQHHGSATAEVYRFHDGRWWQSQFNVEPGQRVGAVREEGRGGVTIDYGTEWFVLDIIEDPESNSRDGRAARVVLQSLRSGEVTEVRHPRDDAGDPLRQRLRDESDLAE